MRNDFGKDRQPINPMLIPLPAGRRGIADSHKEWETKGRPAEVEDLRRRYGHLAEKDPPSVH